MKIGTQFERKFPAIWRDADGNKQSETTTALCEITENDGHWAKFKVIEILDVVNPNPKYCAPIGGAVKAA